MYMHISGIFMLIFQLKPGGQVISLIQVLIKIQRYHEQKSPQFNSTQLQAYWVNNYNLPRFFLRKIPLSH